jgi:hypothetical protein
MFGGVLTFWVGMSYYEDGARGKKFSSSNAAVARNEETCMRE